MTLGGSRVFMANNHHSSRLSLREPLNHQRDPLNIAEGAHPPERPRMQGVIQRLFLYSLKQKRGIFVKIPLFDAPHEPLLQIPGQ